MRTFKDLFKPFLKQPSAEPHLILQARGWGRGEPNLDPMLMSADLSRVEPSIRVRRRLGHCGEKSIFCWKWHWPMPGWSVHFFYL